MTRSNENNNVGKQRYECVPEQIFPQGKNGGLITKKNEMKWYTMFFIFSSIVGMGENYLHAILWSRLHPRLKNPLDFYFLQCKYHCALFTLSLIHI